MPNIFRFVTLLVLVAWCLDYVEGKWLVVSIILWLGWDIIDQFFVGWGWVSKETYTSLKKENKKMRFAQAEREAAMERIEAEIATTRSMMQVLKNTGVPRVVAEGYLQKGRDEVFALYMDDRLRFNNGLAAYAARQRGQASEKPVETTEPAWQTVLGVERDVGYDDARAAYRKLVKANHPDNATSDQDRGTRTTRLSEINAAWDRAEKHFGIVGAA